MLGHVPKVSVRLFSLLKQVVKNKQMLLKNKQSLLSSGKLTGLRELNASYNRLSRVPPELGNCENLERLELTGNHNLSQLPFEVTQRGCDEHPVSS